MIEPKKLLEKFSYDPHTGHLIYRVPGPPRKKVGDRAGSLGKRGYRDISIKGRLYKEHRVIWAMMTGAWPTSDVDHVNRIRSDNRWTNLRLATRAENLSNQGLKPNNKSGFKGVNSRGNSHVAVFRLNGVIQRIGPFQTAQAAAQAYDLAVLKSLGQFAVTNRSLGLL